MPLPTPPSPLSPQKLNNNKDRKGTPVKKKGKKKRRDRKGTRIKI